MDLSILKNKYKSCLGPSSISVALAENNCQRNIWLQYRHKTENNDSIFLEQYKLKHQAGLSNLISYLSIKYPNSIIEPEQKLPIVKFRGVSIYGIPDLVLKDNNDNSISVFDVKTGVRKTSHFFQAGIYFLMLKAIAIKRGLPEPKLKSIGLCYDDGTATFDAETYENKILELKGPSAINEIFLDPTKEKLNEIFDIVSQENLPSATPTSGNCKFCKFKDYCPDVCVEEELIVTNDLF